MGITMKLEVGMYVRTDLGNIGKIVEEYTHQNNKVSYPEPQEWVLDTGYILNEARMYKNEEITKTSHNIIELLEPEDLMYIDISPDDCGGIVVPRVAETQNELDKWKQRFASGECILKGVLTKEQIVSNWYLLRN